jgi:hypothetical protein
VAKVQVASGTALCIKHMGGMAIKNRSLQLRTLHLLGVSTLLLGLGFRQIKISTTPTIATIDLNTASLASTIWRSPFLNASSIKENSSDDTQNGTLVWSSNIVLDVRTPTQPANSSHVQFGNQTAFEILEQTVGCRITTRSRRFCQKKCNEASSGEGEMWCKNNCAPRCDGFTCRLGNPPPLPIMLELVVYPPSPTLSRTDRLIPRIVHQTWHEPITKEKYPNWINFQRSFQEQGGYEYRFYTDDEARTLIQTHFPTEIVTAYDDLLPGAYKADLFRYCALLLYGGVYADIDTLRLSNLDDVIKNDTGFMVPLDLQQFSPYNSTLCLWNGLMAASPGHPYLAQVIENVVNGVRNRYNLVDFAHMVSCPFQTDPKEMFAVAYLYATGPCMLGLSVNQVLGRHEQETFDLGETPGGRNNDIPGKSIFLDAVINKVCIVGG